METFQEFQQNAAPERSTSSIISHAFTVYKSMFLYALLAIAVYFIAAMVLQFVTGFNSQVILEEINNSNGDYSSINFWGIPGFAGYYAASGVLGLLVSPLYVGLIFIANKANNQERIQLADLFIGYRQNTLNIILYSLISSILMGLGFALCFIPGLLVLPLLFLGYPILLFENASFSEALSKSFSIGKENFVTLLGTSVLALLISVSGVILCVIGVLLTALFYMVATYSAYCAFVGKPRMLVTNP